MYTRPRRKAPLGGHCSILGVEYPQVCSAAQVPRTRTGKITLRDLCCLIEPSKFRDHLRGNRYHSKHPSHSQCMERKEACSFASSVDLTRFLFWLRFCQNSPLQRTGPLPRTCGRHVFLKSNYIISSFELDIQNDRPQVKKEGKVRGIIYGFSTKVPVFRYNLTSQNFHVTRSSLVDYFFWLHLPLWICIMTQLKFHLAFDKATLQVHQISSN